jgi:hypothetical protein
MSKPKKKHTSSLPEQNISVTVSMPNKFSSSLLALILFLLAIGVYANTIANFYTLDDVAAFTQNKLVQKGTQGIPEILKTGFSYGYTGDNEGTYRPISLISFALEKSIWGNNPHLSHLINVLIFAVTILLLFFLLQKMFGAGKQMLCFLCCALYAVHPIHTEAIASIKSRDELFCMLFAMLAVYSFLRSVDNEKRPDKAITWSILGFAMFFLSMLSKETSLSFMFIIPLTIYYFRPVNLKSLGRIFIICLLASGSYLLLRNTLFGSIVNIHKELQSVDNFMSGMPWSSHFAVAFAVIGKYIWLLLFPVSLSFDYSYHQVPLFTWANWQALLPLLITLSGVAYAIFTLTRKDFIGYAILFFFLSLAVVSNLFPGILHFTGPAYK